LKTYCSVLNFKNAMLYHFDQNVILQISWNRSSVLLYCFVYSIYLSIGMWVRDHIRRLGLVKIQFRGGGRERVRRDEATVWDERSIPSFPFRNTQRWCCKLSCRNSVSESVQEERCRGEWHATSRRNVGGISTASRCSFVTGWLSSPHSVEADPVVRDLHVVRECTWCILCRDELVFIRRPGNFADSRSGILTWRGANF